ncbi:MAG: DNA-binding protein [Acidobacteria bacterium]|nr:MAG: DNA-binding protein [Acidobacteriota bacterium]
MSAPVNPQVIGEHIRRLRSDRGLSVRAFAARTGFSPSFISQLENGQVSPSLGSLQKIAEALGVTLGEFFVAAETGEEPLIVRLQDRRRLDSTWTDAHIEALGAMARSRRLEPVLVIFGPGGKSGPHPHAPAAEEFAFIIRGEVTLTLADEENVMVAGDAVTLPPQAPRLWENRSRQTAEILIVSSRTPI